MMARLPAVESVWAVAQLGFEAIAELDHVELIL
jgi:hypothetical protein